MALPARKIKFKIEKGTKKPKPLNKENSIFVIYSPEKIVIKPQTFKFAFLDYSIHLPEDIPSTFLIMPNLRDEGLQLTHYSNTNVNERIRLEYWNKTLNKTFTPKKKSKIALFMTLNEETGGLEKEFEVIKTDK